MNEQTQQTQEEMWSKDTYGKEVTGFKQPDPAELDTYQLKKKEKAFKELKEPEPVKPTKKEEKANVKIAMKKRSWGSDCESDSD